MAKKTKESDDSKKVEFKDFKKSVTRGEFDAILSIANIEYNKLLKVIKDTDYFNEKMAEGMKEIKEQSKGMPPGLANKLIKGIKRKAKAQVTDMFSEEIARHIEITDFINRFKSSGEELPYLDFTFLKID